MTGRDDAELDALCEAHGIVTRYRDNWDEEHEAPAATKRALLAAMGALEPLAAPPAREPLMRPAKCATLAEDGARLFGPAIQLYALRSKRNWGIGDFTDLAAVIAQSARQGAALVGINPLHELFHDRPEAASPYSPSSRLTVNPMYLDVEAIPDFAECEDARATVRSAPFQARLSALRETELVDHTGVAAAKWPLLAVLFDHFRLTHLASMSERGRAFRTFVEDNRERVFDAALFAALQAHHRRRDDHAWGWPAWPPAYRDRNSEAVREFARDHADAVDFHLYLQWQADLQLAHAAQVAREEGMPVGLYRDLAVGANPGGAETWREPQLFAASVHIGAPPDDFNRGGQDWGLPPWIPDRLSASGYAPWVALLRANMRHAGALRIDHVMGLLRLFWVPAGTTPADGAYVRYPLSDLLALLALESVRSGCIVVGEDLGTVPDDLRQTLKGAGIYSYRVLYFERDAAGVFLPPDEYPAHALVAISTHDLPTLRGYWQGTDLAAREALGAFPTVEVRDQQFGERHEGRARLRDALVREGFASLHDDLSPDDVFAIHAYAARTACALMTFQLEDVFGQALQANLPATMDDQYPNWRRKLALPIEDWELDGRFAAMCAAIRRERPRPTPSPSN
jgi:(1->4)-alpha-D-glucan 1-alpha-D-glucosylmutase